MAFRDTDREWQELAATDACYPVLTATRFKDECLDEAAVREFFETGDTHVRGCSS